MVQIYCRQKSNVIKIAESPLLQWADKNSFPWNFLNTIKHFSKKLYFNKIDEYCVPWKLFPFMKRVLRISINFFVRSIPGTITHISESSVGRGALQCARNFSTSDEWHLSGYRIFKHVLEIFVRHMKHMPSNLNTWNITLLFRVSLKYPQKRNIFELDPKVKN